MRTRDLRELRRLDGFDVVPSIPVPCDLLDALQEVQPLLDRLRRREWALMITGPRSAAERDQAAMLQGRLLELAEALEARR